MNVTADQFSPAQDISIDAEAQDAEAVVVSQPDESYLLTISVVMATGMGFFLVRAMPHFIESFYQSITGWSLSIIMAVTIISSDGLVWVKTALRNYRMIADVIYLACALFGVYLTFHTCKPLLAKRSQTLSLCFASTLSIVAIFNIGMFWNKYLTIKPVLHYVLGW